MLRTRYALCANRIIRDADENRVSVIDISDDITVASLPVVIPRLSFIWVISREQADPEEYDATLTLRLNGDVIFQNESVINFQGALTTRTILVVGGITLNAPGRLTVTWDIQGQHSAESWMDITSQAHVAQGQANVLS